mgnify:CR=1 FL=1
MEQIIENIGTPSWWFTGLFFLAVGIALKALIDHAPSFILRFFKGMRLQSLRKLRRQRKSLASIYYEISKSQSYFIIFIAMFGLFLIIFSITPMTAFLREGVLIKLLISSPLFFIETIWLMADDYCRDLVKEHNRMQKFLPRLKNNPE